MTIGIKGCLDIGLIRVKDRCLLGTKSVSLYILQDSELIPFQVHYIRTLYFSGRFLGVIVLDTYQRLNEWNMR
jgi:hypothetical protein